MGDRRVYFIKYVTNWWFSLQSLVQPGINTFLFCVFALLLIIYDLLFFLFFFFFFFIDATFIRQFSFFIGLINSYFVIIFIFFIVQPHTSIFPHPYNFYNRHDNSLGEPSTKFCYFFFKLIPIFLDQPYNFITRAWRRSACVFGRAGYVW